MKKEKLEDFKPTRWIVPELREPPTSMTLYPHIFWEDIDSLVLTDRHRGQVLK